MAGQCGRAVWALLPRWLDATVSSERATSSLSGTGGNLPHTSNWTKCLSNLQPSLTDQINRPKRRHCFCSVSLVLFLASLSPPLSLPPLSPPLSGEYTFPTMGLCSPPCRRCPS